MVAPLLLAGLGITFEHSTVSDDNPSKMIQYLYSSILVHEGWIIVVISKLCSYVLPNHPFEIHFYEQSARGFMGLFFSY